ncbi:hypothetical protein Y032_0232g3047 [Ancylostoma ceylanicum]|uniref:Uncharacterized protein n=1 Tax=Ancylostoma ceylanicum TaxID=53326 RepID=A0A016SGF2_9BILA|nr:hypothetical protein Y032_0232g3047 [Ancylostoma ceylanicum]
MVGDPEAARLRLWLFRIKLTKKLMERKGSGSKAQRFDKITALGRFAIATIIPSRAARSRRVLFEAAERPPTSLLTVDICTL